MTKKFALLPIILLVVAFSFGCSIKTYPEEEKKAEKFINRYFTAIKYGNFNAAQRLYSFKGYEPAEVNRIRRGVKQAILTFGPLKSFEINRKMTRVMKNKGGDVTIIVYYNLTYTRIKTIENFTIKRLAGAKNFTIRAHTFEKLELDGSKK